MGKDLITKINGGWVENPIQSMTRIILENGFGNQPTQLWIGLIGHQANLTTIIDNNAWSTSDMTTLETPPTTGMIGIATLLLITSAKSHVERKLDKAFIRISYFFKISFKANTKLGSLKSIH